MKKRMLALLLAAVLCFGLLPTTVAAETVTEPEAKIGDTDYATFTAALTAANNTEGGATITLLKDDILIRGEITGNVTIKPNSHAITYKNSSDLSDSQKDELTVANGGELTFDGRNSSSVFNVPIKIENGAAVELILLKTVAPVTFTGDGTGATLTIDGSNLGSLNNQPFVVPANAGVQIKAVSGTAVTFNSIQINGGRTLQDIIASGYGAQGGENDITWIDMNVTDCGWVQIVSAPITSFYVTVQKAGDTLASTPTSPYTTTAAAGDTLTFGTNVSGDRSALENLTYSWKLDGNEVGTGSPYTWMLADTDIGHTHTITCTVTTSDGFSLTKTLSVTINQKPVKMELTLRSDISKTNTYYYDSIDAALGAIKQSIPAQPSRFTPIRPSLP